MFYVNYYLSLIDDEESTNDNDQKSRKNGKHRRKKNLGVVEEAVGKHNDFDISGDTTGKYLLCNTKLTKTVLTLTYSSALPNAQPAQSYI